MFQVLFGLRSGLQARAVQLPTGDCQPCQVSSITEVCLEGSPLVMPTARLDPVMTFGQVCQLQVTQALKEPSNVFHELERLHLSIIVPLSIMDVHVVLDGVDVAQQFPLWEQLVFLVGHLLGINVDIILPASVAVLAALGSRASGSCGRGSGRGLLIIW